MRVCERRDSASGRRGLCWVFFFQGNFGWRGVVLSGAGESCRLGQLETMDFDKMQSFVFYSNLSPVCVVLRPTITGETYQCEVISSWEKKSGTNSECATPSGTFTMGNNECRFFCPSRGEVKYHPQDS